MSASAVMLGLTTTISVAFAGPTDKAACAKAFEDAQRLRKDHHLVDAKEALLVCAQDVCPKAARTPCSQWLSEVEKSLPSIVVIAKTPDGTETADARLVIDGKMVRERLDGRTLDLDPGEHVIRLEPAAGEAVEQRVMLSEGTQQRTLEFVLGAPKPKADGGDESSGKWQPSPVAIVAFAVSGAALVVGVATGVSALMRADRCKEELCNSGLVDEGLAQAHASTAMFVIAGAAAALGTITIVVLSRREPATGVDAVGLLDLELGVTSCSLVTRF